uniref:Kringle-containing protein marking the eye and the nose n=1 Tax=Naja naja TaxID=35670 RepID=A0A8C6VP53_NAJNA
MQSSRVDDLSQNNHYFNRTAPGSAGKPCLYWNQTREHAYNTAKYPNGEWGLGSHNYCRNPDGDVQPWCYISENEEGIYWKYCDIPTCHTACAFHLKQ